MIRANTSETGLTLGQDDVNMTYMYGLGDFFSVMFEDTSVANLLLESSTMVASEVYSRFLQLTSTLSLEDIQTTTGSQVKLILINSTDLLEGTVAEYKLPENCASARYVANRPLAPTELLEQDVDYRITQGEDGSCKIRFAQPLESYAVSSRLLPDGTTKQYALWFVDAHLDERLISQYFGNLLSLSPENSSERFADFVYGLFYVYVQGPSLSTLRKGLNLVLGIPLARLNETVIDIRAYLQTDQYIVVTDQNQYLIPYGLQPKVAVGDTLRVGDEIASWVEVKDYVNDGDWWINLYIPNNIVPTVPPGQNTRYATPGSELDYVMRNYLKTHTFLVNVNVTTFKNNQQFSELFDIIKRAKPTYTQPIYVWTVLNDENVPFEDSLRFGIDSFHEEDVGGAYRYMRRNSTKQLLRGKSRFIRFNAPKLAANPVGEDVYLNSSDNTAQTLELNGYANTVTHFRPNTEEEIRWVELIANRSSDTWHRRRNQIGFRRDRTVVDSGMQAVTYVAQGPSQGTPDDAGDTPSSVSGAQRRTRLCDLFRDIPENARIVPLAVISQTELEEKCASLGVEAPSRSHRHFFLAGRTPMDAINMWAIDGAQPPGPRVQDLYPTLFRRDNPLKPTSDLNTQMLRQFLPDADKLTEVDALAGFRITCDLVSLCLLSHNPELASPSFLTVHDDLDQMGAEILTTPTRGMAPHGAPFYMGRANIALEDPVQVAEPGVDDPSAELAGFLQALGVDEQARVVPLTVVSEAEFELKCSFWGLTPPEDYERYFVMKTSVQRNALNVHVINDNVYQSTPVQLVGTRVNPLTGQEEPAYTLYPDFYRRDSDVPQYPGLTRYNLREYLPDYSDIDPRDMLLGYRAERGVIALYLVSNAAAVSAGDYWLISHTSSPRLQRVSSGEVEQQGLLVIPPYKNAPSLNYNTYDQAINDQAVNASLDMSQAKFMYRDMYNQTLPVTRGGMVLRHRVDH